MRRLELQLNGFQRERVQREVLIVFTHSECAVRLQLYQRVCSEPHGRKQEGTAGFLEGAGRNAALDVETSGHGITAAPSCSVHFIIIWL